MQVDDLPAAWELKQLGDVCAINPSKAEVRGYPDDLDVTFVPMAAVSEAGGAIDSPDIRKLGEVKKGYTYFREGDVLFAKITPCMENGKAAVARGLANGLGFGSTEFHVLRPQKAVLPEWVFYWIRRPSFRERAAASFTGSVGQQRVPDWFLSEHQIPLPPLEEQRRIVGRIGELARRIQEAKGLRRAARQDAEALLPAALEQTVATGRGQFPAQPLGELVRLTGGGTPSKKEPSYWNGSVPWVSPKDMKSWEIADSEEHVTEEAVSQSAARWIEPGVVLVVVRGMILAKMLPVAIARTRLTVNQDMKALHPKNGLMPEFIAYMLKGSEQDVLAKVETAAHGTRRLRTEILTALPIPVPPLAQQRRIVAYLDAVRAKAQTLLRLEEETQQELDALMPSALDRAFRGEL